MPWDSWRQQLSASQWLQLRFYGNSLPTWLAAASVFVVSLFLLRLAKSVVGRRAAALAERRKLDLAQVVVGLAAAARWWFLLAVSLSLASTVIEFPDGKLADLVGKVVFTALLL
ncbi:MAG TPA: hypothetical protein VHB99_00290, partial [Pirellulales bacterium]|nr:hypothetical protein [Pirellulales bacterium]